METTFIAITHCAMTSKAINISAIRSSEGPAFDGSNISPIGIILAIKLNDHGKIEKCNYLQVKIISTSILPIRINRFGMTKRHKLMRHVVVATTPVPGKTIVVSHICDADRRHFKYNEICKPARLK